MVATNPKWSLSAGNVTSLSVDVLSVQNTHWTSKT